jgi:hypothetical protein
MINTNISNSETVLKLALQYFDDVAKLFSQAEKDPHMQDGCDDANLILNPIVVSMLSLFTVVNTTNSRKNGSVETLAIDSLREISVSNHNESNAPYAARVTQIVEFLNKRIGSCIDDCKKLTSSAHNLLCQLLEYKDRTKVILEPTGRNRKQSGYRDAFHVHNPTADLTSIRSKGSADCSLPSDSLHVERSQSSISRLPSLSHLTVSNDSNGSYFLCALLSYLTESQHHVENFLRLRAWLRNHRESMNTKLFDSLLERLASLPDKLSRLVDIADRTLATYSQILASVDLQDTDLPSDVQTFRKMLVNTEQAAMRCVDAMLEEKVKVAEIGPTRTKRAFRARGSLAKRVRVGELMSVNPTLDQLLRDEKRHTKRGDRPDYASDLEDFIEERDDEDIRDGEVDLTSSDEEGEDHHTICGEESGEESDVDRAKCELSYLRAIYNFEDRRKGRNQIETGNGNSFHNGGNNEEEKEEKEEEEEEEMT